jgi:hypothetical protein
MRGLVIGVVLLAGGYLGWKAAAHSPQRHAAPAPTGMTRVVSLPRTYTVAVVNVPAPISKNESDARELAELKARNRRLEALVKVLRAREERDR